MNMTKTTNLLDEQEERDHFRRVAKSVQRSTPPKTNVQFPSDGKTLQGWLFRPKGAGVKSPFPAVIWNHGSEDGPQPSEALTKTFGDNGFVTFYPVRRFHKPSIDGPFINDLIVNDQTWIGLNELENRDVFNALKWLKKQPFVDPERIVVSGCSFGGVQTLLSAEKGGGFRVAIAFSPGAISWHDGTGPIPLRLGLAAAHRKLPMFILQAKNDYSLGPTNFLGPMLEASKLLHKVKQYPIFGTREPCMSDEDWHQVGHAGFALRGGDIWGHDVFAFIKEAFRDGGDMHK